ncbi:MAG: hypothetical protein ACRCX8_03420 [Sarcina sp.]
MAKLETKEFLGMELRVIDDEYVPLKDIFEALNRLDVNGDVTTRDKEKVNRLVGEHNIKKINIESKSNKPKSRKIQECICCKISELEKYDILSIFGKNGVRHTNERLEYTFVNNVKSFYKYTNVSLKTQVSILNYHLDLTIGSCCIVEFDEKQHESNKENDMNRMYNVTSYLCDCDLDEAKDYKTFECEEFTIYDMIGLLWVRVRDENCLSWINKVDEHYDEIGKGDKSYLMSMEF